jgi:hypothetical protein
MHGTRRNNSWMRKGWQMKKKDLEKVRRIGNMNEQRRKM